MSPYLVSVCLTVPQQSRCLLTEGEYELVMADTDGKSKISPKKSASWEIIDSDTATLSTHQFQAFTHSPTLKFRLSWSSEPAGAMVERPRPLMPRDNCGLEAGGGQARNRLEKTRKEKQQQVVVKQQQQSGRSHEKLRGGPPAGVTRFGCTSLDLNHRILIRVNLGKSPSTIRVMHSF